MREWILALSLLACLEGCALLGFQEDRPEDSDPILAAAMRVRNGRDRGPSWASPATSALSADPEYYEEQLNRAVAYREVIPGMGMREVRSILGEPRQVDRAGTGDGNERWVYSTSTTGKYGLGGSNRTIYFEQGRVAGWESPR